jgi:hypothetical protein
MDTLTQLQQNRTIIQDFTDTTLAAIPSLYARLIYLASLRDLSSGRYEHSGLVAVYGDVAVQQALTRCHEEVFEKILETPLAGQQQDLEMCFMSMRGEVAAVAAHWQKLEAYRMFMPVEPPDYLKELFCSNLRALLQILNEERSTVRSNV